MTATSHSRGRRGRRSRRQLNDRINVTPLVDVMLVLLIVFMVTATKLASGVPVELPKTDAKSLPSESDPLTITVDKNGKIFIQETEISLAELAPRLKAIAKNGFEERIYLRGDENGNYGPVMRVMAAINTAGFTNIGLVTENLPK
ncbi:MAG: biopolymer transporter ExbD [Robiginitomaculum sp.]